MSTQYYAPPWPPAGTYPYQYPPQQPQSYYPTHQQQQQYSPPPPQQYQQYSPPVQAPPQQSWQPTPPQQGGFHGPPPQSSWNPEQIWAEYNNPPDPQYGRPNDVRSLPEEAHSQGLPYPEGDASFPGQQGEGERGLGATVLGGAGGAFLGHKMHHGALGTVGGLALGALAANAFEHHEKRKKEERRLSRAYDDGYDHGEERPHHRSRGIEDGDDYDDKRYEDVEEEEDYYRPRRHHHHHHHGNDYYDDGGYQDDYVEEGYGRHDY